METKGGIQSALAVALLAFVLAMVTGCTSSVEPGSADVVTLEPLQGTARNITLTFYSDTTGGYIGRQTLAGEETVNMYIDPGNEPVKNGYYVFAKAENFISEMYVCSVGEAVAVDRDACPKYKNSLTGMITIEEPSWPEYPEAFFHSYSNGEFQLEFPDGTSGTFRTDARGRFAFGNLPDDFITMRIEYDGRSRSFHNIASDSTGSWDIIFYNGTMSYAPNIYLYPENDMDVHVELGFPEGGKVVKSEPEYGDGWDVFVSRDGVIDKKYDYLFYEAITPDINNYERGWVFSVGDLSAKLPGLLYDYGFEGREIDDFMDFWLPHLNKAPYYAFYPQEADEMTLLKITPQPESVLRVLLYVEPLSVKISLPAPTIDQRLERKGFTAVEWGITGSPELIEK